jgi:hypothetical protein
VGYSPDHAETPMPPHTLFRVVIPSRRTSTQFVRNTPVPPVESAFPFAPSATTFVSSAPTTLLRSIWESDDPVTVTSATRTFWHPEILSPKYDAG